MANIASQIKRNRQNETRRHRNKARRSLLRTEMRKFNAAVASGDADTASSQMRAASRALDKAAEHNVVHRNFAANHKAKMARRLKSLAG